MLRVSESACSATAARRSSSKGEMFAPQDRLVQGAARARQRTAGRCPADRTPGAGCTCSPQKRNGNNLSRMNTYAKCAANPFGMRTSKSLNLKPRVINTYKKKGGGGGLIVTQWLPADGSPESTQRARAAFQGLSLPDRLESGRLKAAVAGYQREAKVDGSCGDDAVGHVGNDTSRGMDFTALATL